MTGLLGQGHREPHEVAGQDQDRDGDEPIDEAQRNAGTLREALEGKDAVANAERQEQGDAEVYREQAEFREPECPTGALGKIGKAAVRALPELKAALQSATGEYRGVLLRVIKSLEKDS